jgi:hypothetical protein
MVNVKRFLIVAYSIVFAATPALAEPQMPTTRPANGWVGGPYKVKAVDVTGDKVVDLLL